MDKKESIRKEAHPDAGRRKLLKAAAAAGGAAAATVIVPGGWRKPIAQIGALPAHAQVSDTRPRLFNLLVETYVAPDSRLRGAIGPTHMATFDFEDPLAGVSSSALITATVPGADRSAGGARVLVVVCTDPVPAPGQSLQNLGAWGAYNASSGMITFPFSTGCVDPIGLCVTLEVGGRLSDPLCQDLE